MAKKRCIVKTKKGTRCKNKAGRFGKRCWTHRSIKYAKGEYYFYPFWIKKD